MMGVSYLTLRLTIVLIELTHLLVRKEILVFLAKMVKFVMLANQIIVGKT